MKTNFVAKQVSDLAGRKGTSIKFALRSLVVGSTSATACSFSDVQDLRVRCVYPDTTGVAELTTMENSKGDRYGTTGNGTALFVYLYGLRAGSYIVTVSGVYGSVPFESKVVIVVGGNEQHTDVTSLSSFNAEVPEVMYIETPATPTE